MNIQELLEPRYRVMADYPNNPFAVGSIQEVSDQVAAQMQQYPHLFYKLQWWEERKMEDLPRYVRIFDVVWEVSHWSNYVSIVPHAESDKGAGRTDNFLSVTWYFNKANSQPATKEEYEQYELLKESRL